jgi:glyoxylase-like metal-dependent hydrolase (beta-lactamase superfamily II)
MYRQGLGDCFLVSMPGAGGKPFHMMIDCGLLQGTKNIKDRLGAVLDDVIAVTGGTLDVLVVTHEHYDHIIGFSLLRDKFAPAGQVVPGKLAVKAAWFAWTEDPADQLAGEIRRQREARKAALAGLAARLDHMGAAAPDVPAAVSGALAFFGMGAGGKPDAGAGDADGLGITAKAMASAVSYAAKGAVRYFRPGDVWTDDALPGIRVLVLGPPHDRASMNKTDSATEVYHLDAGGLEDSVRMAAAVGGDAVDPDPFCPFEQPYRRQLSLLQGDATSAAGAFLAETYFNPKPTTPETDRAWRRIDGAWLGSAEQLALALDSSTNNTSLVLAIELPQPDGKPGGDVLLFPGDAQVGNWLSWHDVKWDGFTTADLLARTKFYKVGHHGSHNATLKGKGLELMPKGGLTAFIPVDHQRAVEKKWFEMPLDALIEALGERCGNAVVRIDQNATVGVVGLSAGGTGGPFDTLYYDWTCEVPTAT